MDNIKVYQPPGEVSQVEAFIEDLHPKLREKLDSVLERTTEDFLARMDLYKFKPGADPRQVIRMLTLVSEGMLAETGAMTAAEINALFAEYKKSADMLRQFLYKEEYL